MGDPPIFDTNQNRSAKAFELRNVKRESTSLTVVTAADQRFVKGAYLSLWTMLRANRCHTILYDLGIDRDDPQLRQIKQWGVEVWPFDRNIPAVKGWQTYMKPWLIRDAMRDHETLFWLDSDTGTSGSFQSAEKLVDAGIFVPDHGVYWPTHNDSQPEVREYLGQPKSVWRENKYPTAGILGLKSKRDRPLIDQWLHRIERLMLRPDLVPKVAFYDQGVLMDLLPIGPDDLADGLEWNNFDVQRTGTVQQVMAEIYGGEHRICHYAGTIKPWAQWDFDLNWCDPTQ